MITRFKSIAHEKTHAYMIETNYHPYSNSGQPLADWAWMYETYGDGICQHSGEYRVQRELFIDFCASLADYLVGLKAEERDEICHELRYKWPDQTDRKNLEFAYNLRYNEAKPDRYYCPSERKISSAESKKYDKRWQKVPTWADGGALAMAQIISNREYGQPDLIDWYRLVSDCYNYIIEQNGWSQQPATLLELPDQYMDLDSRFDTVSAIIKSCGLLQYARRSVEGYRENLENRARQASNTAA